MSTPFKLDLNGIGVGLVELDGVEVGSAVRAVDLHAEVGELTRVTLHLSNTLARVNAPAQVKTVLGGVAWQPIVTAPKDGHPFLGHVPTISDEDFNPSGVVEVYYQEGEGFIGAMWNPEQDCWEARVVRPKWWMPLPDPPAEEDDRQ